MEANRFKQHLLTYAYLIRQSCLKWPEEEQLYAKCEVTLKNFYSLNLRSICSSLLETNLNKAKYSFYEKRNEKLLTIHFSAAVKTLVFGNLFKLFRLPITFALEVYHLGIKRKTNKTIVLFFSLSQQQTGRANVMVSLKSVNKLPNTRVFIAGEKWMVSSTGVGGLISLQNGNLRR